MRKYEKIRENIMIMQQLNSKSVEKPIMETPGPNHYEINYDQVQNNGFAVNLYIFINLRSENFNILCLFIFL